MRMTETNAITARKWSQEGMLSGGERDISIMTAISKKCVS